MEMFEYTEKVMEHFRNPHNVGEIKDPDGVGKVGNPICGDLMEIQIKVQDNRLADVKFRTFGCGAAVATSSMVTEMARGKSLEEALKITRADVAEELGGLPPIKMHCSNLAADALHAAIHDYMTRKEEKEKAGPAEEEYDYDVIIVGGGPGGLTTGIQCAYRGLKTVVFEGETWGGILTRLCPDKLIENYPGLSGRISSKDLVESWLEELKSVGAEMRHERVVDITPDKVVKTTDGEYKGRVVVLATGSTPAWPGIAGEKKFEDKGVHYYVTNPEYFVGKRVLVVGGGNTAVASALSLANIAESITVAYRGESFRGFEKDVEKMKEISKIKILYSTELLQIQGTDRIERVVLKDKTEDREYQLVVDAIILAIGRTPNTKIFKNLGVELDERGYVKTDENQRTNVEGVFAVGDIASDLELVITAVAHGAAVAHHVYIDLKKPAWAR